MSKFNSRTLLVLYLTVIAILAVIAWGFVAWFDPSQRPAFFSFVAVTATGAVNFLAHVLNAAARAQDQVAPATTPGPQPAVPTDPPAPPP